MTVSGSPTPSRNPNEDDTVPLPPVPARNGHRPVRLLAAGVPALAGLVLIGYVLIQPAVSEDRFGWEPVTEEVRLSLETPPASPAHAPTASSREETAAAAGESAAASGEAESPEGTSVDRDDGPPSGAEPAAGSGLLDLNRASEADLQQLPGIGPAKARAIVEHRERYGPFRSVDDLLNVKGIGPKLLERVRPLVTAGGTGGVTGSGTGGGTGGGPGGGTGTEAP